MSEVGAEEVVDRGQDLRPRAIVERQGQHRVRLPAPLPEDVHVGVAEAVDRLELVADEEQLLAGNQVDEVALKAVGVLELVDHDRAEAPGLALLDLLVFAQQVARVELQVLEVDAGLALLGARVGAREAFEQLLKQVAVALGQLVERRLLDCFTGGLIALEPLPRAAAGRKLGEVEQVLRLSVALET